MKRVGRGGARGRALALGLLAVLLVAQLGGACGEASVPEAPRPQVPGPDQSALAPPSTVRATDDPRLLPDWVRGRHVVSAARPVTPDDARYWSTSDPAALAAELSGLPTPVMSSRSIRTGTASRRVTVVDVGEPARAAEVFGLVDSPLDASSGRAPSEVAGGVRRFTGAPDGSSVAQLVVGGAVVEVSGTGRGSAEVVEKMVGALQRRGG